jgi:hypothetical protein
MIDYYNHEKMISQHLAEAMKAAARERFAVEASTRLAAQQHSASRARITKTAFVPSGSFGHDVRG